MHQYSIRPYPSNEIDCKMVEPIKFGVNGPENRVVKYQEAGVGYAQAAAYNPYRYASITVDSVGFPGPLLQLRSWTTVVLNEAGTVRYWEYTTHYDYRVVDVWGNSAGSLEFGTSLHKYNDNFQWYNQPSSVLVDLAQDTNAPVDYTLIGSGNAGNVEGWTNVGIGGTPTTGGQTYINGYGSFNSSPWQVNTQTATMMSVPNDTVVVTSDTGQALSYFQPSPTTLLAANIATELSGEHVYVYNGWQELAHSAVVVDAESPAPHSSTGHMVGPWHGGGTIKKFDSVGGIIVETAPVVIAVPDDAIYPERPTQPPYPGGGVGLSQSTTIYGGTWNSGSLSDCHRTSLVTLGVGVAVFNVEGALDYIETIMTPGPVFRFTAVDYYVGEDIAYPRYLNGTITLTHIPSIDSATLLALPFTQSPPAPAPAQHAAAIAALQYSNFLAAEWSSDWAAAQEELRVRKAAWLKKCSDDIVDELVASGLPDFWDYYLAANAPRESEAYRAAPLNITVTPPVVTLDTSAGLTQEGVRVTTKSVTFSYVTRGGEHPYAEEVHSATIVGTKTETVTSHTYTKPTYNYSPVYKRSIVVSFNAWYAGGVSPSEAIEVVYGEERLGGNTLSNSSSKGRFGVLWYGQVSNGWVYRDSKYYFPNETMADILWYEPPIPSSVNTVYAESPDIVNAYRAAFPINYGVKPPVPGYGEVTVSGQVLGGWDEDEEEYADIGAGPFVGVYGVVTVAGGQFTYRADAYSAAILAIPPEASTVDAFTLVDSIGTQIPLRIAVKGSSTAPIPPGIIDGTVVVDEGVVLPKYTGQHVDLLPYSSVTISVMLAGPTDRGIFGAWANTDTHVDMYGVARARYTPATGGMELVSFDRPMDTQGQPVPYRRVPLVGTPPYVGVPNKLMIRYSGVKGAEVEEAARAFKSSTAPPSSGPDTRTGEQKYHQLLLDYM